MQTTNAAVVDVPLIDHLTKMVQFADVIVKFYGASLKPAGLGSQ
jgi:hypothetical protein